MRGIRLGGAGSPAEVLRALSHGARRNSLPPPAALIGEWFGSRAVIAPSVEIRAVDPAAAFDERPGDQPGPIGGGGGGRVGGGWIGYLSYPDAGADGRAPRIPEAAGGWTDCVLRLDDDDCWWFESLSPESPPAWVQTALADGAAPGSCDITWSAPDVAAHRAGVLSCLEAIRAGEVYQACVCTQYTGTVTGDPVEFFADAVSRTPAARSAYLAGDWGAVASLSPELFLSRRGEEVTSSPIKGTLPHRADPADLLASAKDVAENIMIVDLVRNDLGHVARTGSVTVSELLTVRAAPGVWHLVSTVTARVAEDVSAAAVLGAAFPPASVTGTPKTRARQLLSQWEPHRRGVYCGTVGMSSPIGGMELNVAIRTVEFDAQSRAVLGVGGGITADSDPDAEWQECQDKAAAIVQSDSVRGLIQPERARTTAS